MGLVPQGADVLDVACGSGRHSWLLAAAGHHVTAVDRDLRRLSSEARPLNVEMVEADLEDGSPWPFEGRLFGGIIVTNYLHRPLLPKLIDSLAPEGVLIYETFAAGNERLGKPSNPAFLLEPGELLRMAGRELAIVAYEHGQISSPRPAIVQRVCAVKSRAPQVL